MAQETGYSPSFKRPAEIIRLRRKRARSTVLSSSEVVLSSGPSSSLCGRISSPEPLLNEQSCSRNDVKRRNPFANRENTSVPVVCDEDGGYVQTRKKVKQEKEAEEKTSAAVSGCSTQKCLSEDDSLSGPEDEQVLSPLLKSPRTIASSSIAPPSCTRYPTDWSLKTRLLFTSPHSLSWAEQPKAQEEALGLSRSCRAQFSSLPQHAQQCLVYWQHPSLPWLSLFPRINAERNFSGRSSPWAHDAALQQSLMRDWSISLSSLYSLLKSGLCPYFYVCSYQLTVLFRAAGLSGSGCITALVSPTTRGLREAMKSEGIEFSLPLVEDRRKSSKQHHSEEEEDQTGSLTEDEDSLSCDGDEHKDDSFSWLKEMGIQDKIRKPDGINLQLHKDAAAVSLDHKPESVVCVEGSHTFNLINFLINCKSLVAAAGSQTGLPPTLLAPTPFRGATANVLKGSSVNVKTRAGSTYQNISSLEITGPILPSSLHAITRLLQLTQKGTFSAALYTHAPSAIMNVNTSKLQHSSGSVDPAGFGLPPASFQHLEQPSSLGKAALTHIYMRDSSYTWKS
ncbi:protein downstream neighbor of son homolog isoform X2 [Nothobranchius furzeri]|uniref:Transcript variant X2 n=1 Tax=Nothobranchius furzeri TaxID=105023 RepID=A0A9D3BJF9_NOTFU|nr:transcript variant X2 [Nothobranchius furzeri]